MGGGIPIGKTNIGDDGRGLDLLATPGWSRARGGLFFVMLGLILITLAGVMGFAKAASVKGGVELPKGPAEGWLIIPGYVNTPDAGAIKLTKEEIFDLVVFGGPCVLGGLLLGFGRLTCGAAPYTSGAKGMFALSGLLTFVAVAALVGGVVAFTLYPEEYPYLRYTFIVSVAASEVWFLIGLAVSGVTLRRPGAARAVGLLVFVATAAAFAATVGWLAYSKQAGRLAVPNPDTRFMEQAVIATVWVLVMGAYWRAVRIVRGAISELLDATGG